MQFPEKTREALNRNHRISTRLQKLARLIEKELAKVGAKKDTTQFSLLIWGEDRFQYVSNGERADVKKAMEEITAKWDKEKDLGPVQIPLGGMNEH